MRAVFCLEKENISLTMFNTDHVVGLAIAAFCTVATSAAVFYATTYVIRNHHNQVKKRQFNRFKRHLLEKIDSIGSQHSSNVHMLANLDQYAPNRSKLLLQANEISIKLMESLDALNIKSFIKKSDNRMDPMMLKIFELETQTLLKMKRELIARIERFCVDIDEITSNI